MCITTLHIWDRCHCKVEQIKICRPHINHTHKQIDSRGCWDCQYREQRHGDRCGASRSKGICRTTGSRFVREYTFESEEAFKVRKFKESGKWELLKDEGGDWRVRKDGEVNETATKLEGLSTVKEDVEKDSPVKRPEVKRVRKEDDQRKIKEEPMDEEQISAGLEEYKRSWTPINQSRKAEGKGMEDGEQMCGGLDEGGRFQMPVNKCQKIKEEAIDDREQGGGILGGVFDNSSDGQLVHGKYGGERSWGSINTEEECLLRDTDEEDMDDVEAKEKIGEKENGESKEQEKNVAEMSENEMIY